MSMKKAASPKKLPLVLAVVGCLYGMSAFAQDTRPPVEDQEEQQTTQTGGEDAKTMETVTVTGSLLRREEYDTINPVQVITAESSKAVGQVDIAEVLQQTSVASGSTQINTQFGGFVVEGGTGVQTVSLRGLGANRTLVLLNGKRPGPAGTRGQVGAFDLNVLPTAALQRAEILKDGASSIYGSDAVAGVINLITRKNVDRPEVIVSTRVPIRGGGEIFEVSGITGWNFDSGNVMLSGSWYKHEALNYGERDFLDCPEDLVWDEDGNRLDRVDRSVIANTPLGGCSSGSLYANTVLDAFTGERYIPSPDGVTIGMIPGYRPRRNNRYPTAGGGQPGDVFFEDVLNFDFTGDRNAIARQDRATIYSTADISFGNVNWTSELLLNRRETRVRGLRQFFPVIGGATSTRPQYRYANDPTFVAPVRSGVAQPIMPFRSDTDVKVNYYYLATGLDGYLPFNDWTWKVGATYTLSDGEYNNLGIRASTSGDVQYSDDAPDLNYFDPDFLSGARMNDLVGALGVWHRGTTKYDQFTVNGLVSGELFNMPAGAVGAALGVEYRKFSIDDQPSDLSRAGDLWGSTSAQVTKGDDSVKEVFAEVEIPLLKGIPAVESLTANVSARYFDYDSVRDSDTVWKAGLSWQMIPSLRLRATKGTSFRAPGLYELYLGNQTGFQSQLAIDPCIDWEKANNDFIRANCAAAGIPGNYAGGGSSATIVTGGGYGQLRPETSNAFTAGIVFTPSFAPVSIALDYFNIEVLDQIFDLDANSILGGCYASPVYPNAYCNMFTRNPSTHPTAPNAIEEVRAQYINVNSQKTRGYDLIVNYDDDFGFGKLELESQVTYVLENTAQLFDSAEASGFETDIIAGYIGNPKLVGKVRAGLERNDWTYTWEMEYVSRTRNLNIDPEHTYLGYVGAIRDIWAESELRHNASIRYEQPNWSFLIGLRNVFDAKPPTISASAVNNRFGNTPALATQYDLYGRSLFVRYNYKF